MSLADSFEQKIKHDELPKVVPLWWVRIGRFLVWFVLFILLILGVVGTGVSLWLAMDPFRLHLLKTNIFLLGDIFDYLFVFWIFLTFCLIGLTVFVFFKTKHGYRYRFSLILVSIVGMFFVFGVALVVGNVSDKVDFLATRMRFYNQIKLHRQHRFYSPENGRISGVVTKTDDGYLFLKSFDHQTWKILSIDFDKRSNIGDCLFVFGNVNIVSHKVLPKRIMPCARGLRHFIIHSSKK